jgi:hypothetical protein
MTAISCHGRPSLSAVHYGGEEHHCALRAKAEPAEAKNHVVLFGLPAVTPLAQVAAPLFLLFIIFVV